MRWYLNINGQNSGPFDETAVVQMIQAGQLTAAWICQDGGSDWVALGAHPPFAQALLAQAGAPGGAPQASAATPPQAQTQAWNPPPAQAAVQPSAQFTPQTEPVPAAAQDVSAPPTLGSSAQEKDSVGRLFSRIPKLFSNPRAYWEDIAQLKGGFGDLLLPNVLLLVGAAALFSFLGSLIALRHFLGWAPGTMILGLFITLILQVVVGVGVWLIMGLLIDAFAGTFGAQKDSAAARKLALGALTPMWLAGILSIIPLRIAGLGLAFGGFAYGCYLLFTGLPKLNQTPSSKAGGYTAAIMGLMLLIAFGLSSLAACPVGCATGCAVRNSLQRRLLRHRVRRLLRKGRRSSLDERRYLNPKGSDFARRPRPSEERALKRRRAHAYVTITSGAIMNLLARNAVTPGKGCLTRDAPDPTRAPRSGRAIRPSVYDPRALSLLL